jgi:hypothetical protein
MHLDFVVAQRVETTRMMGAAAWILRVMPWVAVVFQDDLFVE